MNKRKVLIFDWGGVIAGDNNKIASKILSDKYDLDYQLNRLILLQLVGHLRSENHLRRLGLSLLELV